MVTLKGFHCILSVNILIVDNREHKKYKKIGIQYTNTVRRQLYKHEVTTHLRIRAHFMSSPLTTTLAAEEGSQTLVLKSRNLIPRLHFTAIFYTANIKSWGGLGTRLFHGNAKPFTIIFTEKSTLPKVQKPFMPLGMHFHKSKRNKLRIAYTAMCSQTTYTTQPNALQSSYKSHRNAFTDYLHITA